MGAAVRATGKLTNVKMAKVCPFVTASPPGLAERGNRQNQGQVSGRSLAKYALATSRSARDSTRARTSRRRSPSSVDRMDAGNVADRTKPHDHTRQVGTTRVAEAIGLEWEEASAALLAAGCGN